MRSLQPLRGRCLTVPAEEALRPGDGTAMFSGCIALAFFTHIVRACGSGVAHERSARGGLASWQRQRELATSSMQIWPTIHRSLKSQMGAAYRQAVGWGARIRTWEWRNQNPLPYHLATPQHARNRGDHTGGQCHVNARRADTTGLSGTAALPLRCAPVQRHFAAATTRAPNWCARPPAASQNNARHGRATP